MFLLCQVVSCCRPTFHCLMLPRSSGNEFWVSLAYCFENSFIFNSGFAFISSVTFLCLRASNQGSRAVTPGCYHSSLNTCHYLLHYSTPTVKLWEAHSPFFISAAIFGYLDSYSWHKIQLSCQRIFMRFQTSLAAKLFLNLFQHSSKYSRPSVVTLQAQSLNSDFAKVNKLLLDCAHPGRVWCVDLKSLTHEELDTILSLNSTLLCCTTSFETWPRQWHGSPPSHQRRTHT